jgi:hypothetical protein
MTLFIAQEDELTESLRISTPTPIGVTKLRAYVVKHLPRLILELILPFWMHDPDVDFHLQCVWCLERAKQARNRVEELCEGLYDKSLYAGRLLTGSRLCLCECCRISDLFAARGSRYFDGR